jgi:cytochrome P450
MGEPGDEFQLTEKDRLDMMYLMVVAGIDTTQSALGQMFYEVARDQDLRRRVSAMDAEHVGHAVEEVLRYTSPVTLAGRTLAEDVEMAGCPMGAGERVNLSWIGANRDPKVFAEPETIDVERANAKWHLAFGAGIHTCLGNHLARRELRVALQAVSRLTRFELADPDFRPTYRAGFTRGPIHLPMHLQR